MKNTIALYRRFKKLDLDSALIGFELIPEQRCDELIKRDHVLIAKDENVFFAFIEGYKDTVFCVDPLANNGHQVYPLAGSFRTFLGLILSTGGVRIMRNITVWNKREYINHIHRLENIDYVNSPDVLDVLFSIRFDLRINDMERPFEYINFLVKNFDYDRLNNGLAQALDEDF